MIKFALNIINDVATSCERKIILEKESNKTSDLNFVSSKLTDIILEISRTAGVLPPNNDDNTSDS